MTVVEMRRQKDSKLIHDLYEKYYGNSKRKKDPMARRIKSKQAEIKKKKTKNFGVFNKKELAKIVGPVIEERIISKIIRSTIEKMYIRAKGREG